MPFPTLFLHLLEIACIAVNGAKFEPNLFPFIYYPLYCDSILPLLINDNNNCMLFWAFNTYSTGRRVNILSTQPGGWYAHQFFPLCLSKKTCLKFKMILHPCMQAALAMQAPMESQQHQHLSQCRQCVKPLGYFMNDCAVAVCLVLCCLYECH